MGGRLRLHRLADSALSIAVDHLWDLIRPLQPNSRLCWLQLL